MSGFRGLIARRSSGLVFDIQTLISQTAERRLVKNMLYSAWPSLRG